MLTTSMHQVVDTTSISRKVTLPGTRLVSRKTGALTASGVEKESVAGVPFGLGDTSTEEVLGAMVASKGATMAPFAACPTMRMRPRLAPKVAPDWNSRGNNLKGPVGAPRRITHLSNASEGPPLVPRR